MNKTIALVSCVSKKLAFKAPARRLYCSDWFQKASLYATRKADQWYILSAKYGLLSPDTVIEPYNETLKTMSVSKRRSWAARVLDDLCPILNSGDRVIFLAGDAYRQHLLSAIEDMGCTVEIPMEGLKIGEQLSWLNHH